MRDTFECQTFEPFALQDRHRRKAMQVPSYAGIVLYIQRFSETMRVVDPALLLAVLAHALDLQTWRSLVRQQGLTDIQAVDLMVKFVKCSAGS